MRIIQAYRQVLSKCQAQFEQYAKNHHAKNPPQVAKARTNEDMANGIAAVLAVRSPDETHAEMVANLQKPGEAIMAQVTPLMLATTHMGVGVCTEAGELADALKRWVFYGKELDRENVIEELGDIEFYLEGIRQNLFITRDETLEHNYAKLAGKGGRYEAGYTDAAAIARVDKSGDPARSEDLMHG